MNHGTVIVNWHFVNRSGVFQMRQPGKSNDRKVPDSLISAGIWDCTLFLSAEIPDASQETETTFAISSWTIGESLR